MRSAVSPGFSSSEDAGDFVKTCSSRKMWAAVRLQWINGGGDIQPGSERVAGEKAECQLGITQQDWTEAQGSKPRAAAGSVGQGETPRTEEAWVSHLLQGEVADECSPEGDREGAFWEGGGGVATSQGCVP